MITTLTAPTEPSPLRQIWRLRRQGQHEHAWAMLAAQLPTPLAAAGAGLAEQRQLIDAFIEAGLARIGLNPVLQVLREQQQRHGLPDGTEALEQLLARAQLRNELPTALSARLQLLVLAGDNAPAELQLQLAETLALLQHREAALETISELLQRPGLAREQRGQAHALAALLRYRQGDRQRCLQHLFEAVAYGSRDPITLQFLCRMQCESGAFDAAGATLEAIHDQGQGIPALAAREQRLRFGLALAQGLAEPDLLGRLTAALGAGLVEDGRELLAAAPAVLESEAELLALRDALLRNRLRQPAAPAVPFPTRSTTGKSLRVGLLAPSFHPDSPGGLALALAPQLAAEGLSLVPLPTLADAAAAEPTGPDSNSPPLSLAGLESAAALALAREQTLDVLIDLAGWDDGQRHDLLQQRLAPLQLGWFNTNFSSGLPQLDYLLVDRFQAPTQPVAYTEGLLTLPGSFMALTRPLPPLLLQPNPAGHLVVVAPARHLQNAGVRLWAALLRDAPDRTLAFCHTDLAQEVVWQRLVAAFAAEGIAPERLQRYPAPVVPVPTAVVLDSWPWGHWQSTLSALEQGIAVISRRGPGLHQRRSAGVLELLGLGAFVADSDPEALAIVEALLADGPLQRELQQRIPEQLQSSLLRDASQFAAELADSLRQLSRSAAGASGS